MFCSELITTNIKNRGNRWTNWEFKIPESLISIKKNWWVNVEPKRLRSGACIVQRSEFICRRGCLSLLLGASLSVLPVAGLCQFEPVSQLPYRHLLFHHFIPSLVSSIAIAFCHHFTNYFYHSYISAIHPWSPTINFAVVQSEMATQPCIAKKRTSCTMHILPLERFPLLIFYLLLFSLKHIFFMNFFIFVWSYCLIWISKNITNLLFAYFNYKYETWFLFHVYHELCY